MATWRKVIVSGSAAVLSQVNVASNQQIGTTQSTTFLTGSFTGSFVGNGAGLLDVNASTVITNADLTGDVTSVGNVTTIASGVVTSAMITDDTIVNADINSAAAISIHKIKFSIINNS
jgi:hypothetical protein